MSLGDWPLEAGDNEDELPDMASSFRCLRGEEVSTAAF